ncbi:hypothetical protein [Kitasatospora sp. NPDC059571]|uniref:hypothetical protein n=1 Tax=Kitasatospora sp. NPDC059571 TaxID=3346871 RepID=UPI0036B7DC45
MAERSFGIKVRNFSGLDLTRKSIELPHGQWSGNGGSVPPEFIPQGGTAAWESESDGFGTGTEGRAIYLSDAGEFYIHWDNPFVGSNSFDVNVPPGFSRTFGDISGNNVWVKLVFESPE